MPTVYDVPPDRLIDQLANRMKRTPQVQPPEWSFYAKTGSHASRPPANKDWWYARAASILRKLYLHAPLGVGDLETKYGGRKRPGYSAAYHGSAGSSSIRKCLAQLQAAGYVQKTPKGRALTPEGRSLCDKVSTEIFEELKKSDQTLGKIVS